MALRGNMSFFASVSFLPSSETDFSFFVLVPLLSPAASLPFGCVGTLLTAAVFTLVVDLTLIALRVASCVYVCNSLSFVAVVVGCVEMVVDRVPFALLEARRWVLCCARFSAVPPAGTCSTQQRALVVSCLSFVVVVGCVES